jgi:hypothetical protein
VSKHYTTTLADWQARAEAVGYRFECPVCKHVATPADFKKLGVDPQRAAQECIGRHIPGSRKAFEDSDNADRKGPCNYAAYGLLRLGEVLLMPDGDTVSVMPPVRGPCVVPNLIPDAQSLMPSASAEGGAL